MILPTRWETVFIVGSGPSLRGFDYSWLDGRTTLVVNDALLCVPDATAFFTADSRWLQRRRNLLDRFAGEKYIATSCNVKPRGCIRLLRSREDGLSERLDTINLGGPSGYGALNIAYLKRASKIYLLGFDLTPGRCYDHDDMPEQTRLYEMWARKFLSTVPQLERRNIKVYNTSEQSIITAFEKISTAEMFAIEGAPYATAARSETKYVQ